MIAMRRFRSAASRHVVTPEHRACVQWFVEELRGIGFSASVRETPGRPIAIGHDRGSRGPSALFCGNYEMRPSRLSRGNRGDEAARAAHPCSGDQSTELMAFVEACRAWKAVAGQLPVAVSVLLECEGSGSVGLTSFVHMYADELKANIGLAPATWGCCDTMPAINSVLRGICCEEFAIVVDGDQLAGFGRKVAADPTRILARILGDLHDSSGHVTIPGFYAGINASPRSLHGWSRGAPSGTDDPRYAQCSTVPERDREEGHIEAMSTEPTCEIEVINGSRKDGGGLGFVANSCARLSFHLVCGQEPAIVSQAFRDFARARIPQGSRIEFGSGSSTPPLVFTASSPVFRKAEQALTAEWDRQAVFASGDAAPAIHALHEVLGMETIVISFPGRRDACHGPLFSELAKNYRIGVRSWARILDALAQ